MSEYKRLNNPFDERVNQLVPLKPKRRHCRYGTEHHVIALDNFTVPSRSPRDLPGPRGDAGDAPPRTGAVEQPALARRSAYALLVCVASSVRPRKAPPRKAPQSVSGRPLEYFSDGAVIPENKFRRIGVNEVIGLGVLHVASTDLANARKKLAER